jgi:hypothetical protein
VKKTSVRLIASISLLFVLTMGGCGTKETEQELVTQVLSTFGDPVECTESDSTPPSTELVFSHPVTGKTIRLKSGDTDMTIPIKPTDRFFVMAVAEDPEGVKEIKIYPPSGLECEPVDETGCKVLSSTVPKTLRVGGALTRLWLQVQIEVTGECPPPCKLVSWRKSVWATAVNCSGLETTTPLAVFTVQYP